MPTIKPKMHDGIRRPLFDNQHSDNCFRQMSSMGVWKIDEKDEFK
jgi:hypothetical protein